MIEAVIFDIDGTLIDSNDVHAHVWHEAFAEFGKKIPAADIRSSIGKGGDNLLPDFLSEEEIRTFGESLKMRRGEIFKSTYLQKLRPFTFARELGEKLRDKGMKLAVASSAKGDELDPMLEIIGFSDLIKTKASNDDADRSKPDPDIFLAALKRLGDPDPKRVITVGDSPYDVIGAEKAGMKTIALLSGGFTSEDLKRAGALAIYHSPSELLLNIDESPSSRFRNRNLI